MATDIFVQGVKGKWFKQTRYLLLASVTLVGAISGLAAVK
jgi:hypothetical protein